MEKKVEETTSLQPFAFYKEFWYNMGMLDDLVTIDEEGKINYAGWVEWLHISSSFFHCPTCLALDKCWFSSVLKPKLPQHEKCHCTVINIAKPIPNVNAKAECDINKFTEYIFSDKYAWNGKRALFEKLGYSKNDAQYLMQEYQRQATKCYCNGEYRLGVLDMRGQRINIDIKLEKNGRKIVFTSGWMVRAKGKITNNTPLAG